MPIEAIGQPWLIILSDASDLAHGFALTFDGNWRMGGSGVG